VVAGTNEAILMVESEAKQLSEEVMPWCSKYGHEQMQPVIKAISELKTEIGKDSWEYEMKRMMRNYQLKFQNSVRKK
jgi:polyribonucleotide nucleotidyltransferase